MDAVFGELKVVWEAFGAEFGPHVLLGEPADLGGVAGLDLAVGADVVVQLEGETGGSHDVDGNAVLWRLFAGSCPYREKIMRTKTDAFRIGRDLAV